MCTVIQLLLITSSDVQQAIYRSLVDHYDFITTIVYHNSTTSSNEIQKY